jgi:hypothetical protein
MLNNIVQIENNPDLVRDIESKAVLSVDVSGLTRYRETRRRTLMSKQEMAETKSRLEQIEQEMASLKRIVNELSTLRSRI